MKVHTVTLAIVVIGDEPGVHKENCVHNTYAVVEEGWCSKAPKSMEISTLPSLAASAAEGGSRQTTERATVHFCTSFPGSSSFCLDHTDCF